MDGTVATTKIVKEPTFTMDLYVDPYNKRVRVDDYRGEMSNILNKAEKEAELVKAEKLIIKGRKEHFFDLLEKGFQCEGIIDGYFLGSDMYFFCKYYDMERRKNDYWIEEDHIVSSVQKLDIAKMEIPYPKEYILKKIEKKDAASLSQLYKEVFKIYPTPLHQEEYIIKTIDDGTIYYAFQFENKWISAASAEVNTFYKNAELTDCATLPEYRKHGLMKILLEKLEECLLNEGIYCSYSLARALSFGMNASLHQLGYSYRGRLTNNCNIFDKLEDMNIWVKYLSKK